MTSVNAKQEALLDARLKDYTIRMQTLPQIVSLVQGGFLPVGSVGAAAAAAFFGNLS
jgi:hypothetical protein